ncbi:glycosyltransferase family 8 protein [Megamonas hypermegale]|uniref:glycosyltransferase family 8 protein n=1 Tax=Megamonas hypermegale TaxID=158847 RepID=UPI00255C5856|nr:glycosyltransferase [Megamonas hypermegale]
MNIFTNNLNSKIKYEYLITQTCSNIHIGYGIDNNYARCCASSISSFCINNPGRNFNFHIMSKDLSTVNKNRFKQLAQIYSINICIYEININTLTKLPTQVHLPIATYFRFILPLVLDNVDKLFYIDADILCLQNADDLFNINLDDNIIGAVPDLPWMNKKRNKALNLKNHIYFNAGMLIIDINKWNKFDTFTKVLQVIQNNPKNFRYLDQDALNIVLTNHIQYLDTKFNCIDINSISQKNIILLHFAAHPKPWNIAFPISKICNEFNKNIYQYYENKTPWKNFPLELPKNYKEIKIYAKALRYNKQYIKSLYWSLKYFINKI